LLTLNFDSKMVSILSCGSASLLPFIYERDREFLV
jgi:hypothetical protein